MKDSILREKAEKFAGRIIKLNKYLVNEKKEYTLSKQILRSGTSISANLAEAQFAQSTNDFISKLCISQKEANETYSWLKQLYNGEYITEVQFRSMETDVVEILKLSSSSIITLKNKRDN